MLLASVREKFHNCSLGIKLTALTVFVSCSVLALATATTTVREVWNLKQQRYQNLKSVTEITAYTSTAAVVFRDTEDSQQILEGLLHEPAILGAEILTLDHSLFSKVEREGYNLSPLAQFPESTGLYLDGHEVYIVDHIKNDNEIIGIIRIQATLKDLEGKIRQSLVIALIILIVGMLLSVCLSYIFQRLISKPIKKLLGTIHQISSAKDYSSRVQENRTDEIGVLIQSFNSMLAEIETRDVMLERKVSQRTELLAQHNKIFEMLVTGASLKEIAKLLVKSLEKQLPGVRCTLHQYKNKLCTLECLSGPPSAAIFKEALEDIQYNPKSAKTQKSAQYKQVQFLEESNEDLESQETQKLFDQSDVYTCWSYPLLSSSKDLLGTLACFIPDSRDPTEKEQNIIDSFLHMAAVVMGHRASIDKLENAIDDAEAANKAKSEFLANMSHEIRTPMNGVIGMTDILVESHLGDEQNELALNVKKSAASLLSVINDILDFSKIEAGKLELHSQDFSLPMLFQDIERILGFQAKANGITFGIEIAPSCPKIVHGDPLRLKQVLINLLSNALKFTPAEGAVYLFVEQEKRFKSDDCLLRFNVIDSGVGIEQEKQSHIFKPFSQADSSSTRSFGGTGLGLTISSQLVELMGGTLGIRSEFGVGSVFTFDARFGSAKTSDLEKKLQLKDTSTMQPSIRSPLRILLAEDNKINQEVAARLLKAAGHSVSTVENGAEAVASYQKNSFDLILMDVQMPEVDGTEATRQIRELELSEGLHIPIVALTAHAMKGDRERYLSAGMDGYVTKPINRANLLSEIYRVHAEYSSDNENEPQSE